MARPGTGLEGKEGPWLQGTRKALHVSTYFETEQTLANHGWLKDKVDSDEPVGEVRAAPLPQGFQR